MGDAKRRGTLEERTSAAIALRKIEVERVAARRAEIEASKTPAQRIKERQSKMELIQLMAMFAGFGYYNPLHKSKLAK